MEQQLIEWLKDYGYVILFVWSMLEGEMGLVMAGTMSHTGDMNIYTAIFVAGTGGFIGDQIYFYIGRFNRKYIHQKLKKQRRKIALATLLLQKYGWVIIFVQRYMYGMRTIIPMTIGTTKYSAKMFAIINLISAYIWASITIVLAYIFGDVIIEILHYAKNHIEYAVPLVIVLFVSIYYFFDYYTSDKRKKRVLN
ncbi:putative membrane-associated protein [Thiovulum sp. ES]|nr:putative membrane-associated protein [Thiovulum sp. ES]